jgi:TrmH family RNA methyltransferase
MYVTQRTPDPFANLLDTIAPSGRQSELIKKLRRLVANPASQRAEGLAFAEGVHLASELVASGLQSEHFFFSPKILRTGEGRALVESFLKTQPSSKLHRIDDALMGQLCNVSSHQGIVSVIPRIDWKWEEITGTPAIVLVACGIQDPGNTGTLVRTTEAAWGSGLICTGTGADPWSSRALRASAGSIFRLPVLRITDPAEAISRLKNSGFTLVGADPRAECSYKEPLGQGPLAIFCGSEGAGLSADQLSLMDRKVRIPTRVQVESLNVAAAAALLLFEAASQRPSV